MIPVAERSNEIGFFFCFLFDLKQMNALANNNEKKEKENQNN